MLGVHLSCCHCLSTSDIPADFHGKKIRHHLWPPKGTRPKLYCTSSFCILHRASSAASHSTAEDPGSSRIRRSESIHGNSHSTKFSTMRLSSIALIFTAIASTVAAVPRQQPWSRRETRAEAGKYQYHSYQSSISQASSIWQLPMYAG